MATIVDVVSHARTMVRDFPHPFDGAFVGDGATSRYKMAHPLVLASSFTVIRNDGTPTTLVAGTDYTLDARNGFVTFSVAPVLGKQIVVSGDYFDWFFDTDLTYFANNVVGDHSHGRDDFSLSAMDEGDSELTVIVIGTLVQAFWALLAEVARDIDVHSPESVFIPASQRYQQILSMLEYWQHEYNTRAEALNVGLSRIEMLNLRRVSMSTGRLVPLYIAQELEEIGTPERIYPPIDTGLI